MPSYPKSHESHEEHIQLYLGTHLQHTTHKANVADERCRLLEKGGSPPLTLHWRTRALRRYVRFTSRFFDFPENPHHDERN